MSRHGTGTVVGLLCLVLVGAVGAVGAAAPDQRAVVGGLGRDGGASTGAGVDQVASWTAACPVLDAAAPSTQGLVSLSVPDVAPTDDQPASQLTLSAADRTEQTRRTGAALAIQVPSGDSSEAATGVGRADGPLAVGAVLARSLIDLEGEGRGLSAALCPQPDDSFWFVGPGAAPGQRDRLLLHNPTESPAVVDVLVLGPEGEVEVPGSDGTVLQPGGSAVVLVDALIPDMNASAMLVRARSGVVSAMVQSTRTDGLVPQGTAFLPSSAAPARSVLIPGIPQGAGSATLVVASPGDAVDVTAELVTAGGVQPLPDLDRLRIGARSAVAFDLDRMEPGLGAAVRLSASGPIVAGLKVATASGAEEADGSGTGSGGTARAKASVQDFAWLPGQRAGPGPLAMAALGGRGSATVVVASAGSPVSAWATAYRAGADPSPPVPIDLPAGATATVEVQLPDGEGPAVLVLRGDPGTGLLAAAAVQAGSLSDGPVLSAGPGVRIVGRVVLPAVRPAPPGSLS